MKPESQVQVPETSPQFLIQLFQAAKSGREEAGMQEGPAT